MIFISNHHYIKVSSIQNANYTSGHILPNVNKSSYSTHYYKITYHNPVSCAPIRSSWAWSSLLVLLLKEGIIHAREHAFAGQLHFPVHTCVQLTLTSPATGVRRRLSNNVRDNLQLAAFSRAKRCWAQVLEMPVLRGSRQEDPSVKQQLALCF